MNLYSLTQEGQTKLFCYASSRKSAQLAFSHHTNQQVPFWSITLELPDEPQVFVLA